MPITALHSSIKYSAQAHAFTFKPEARSASASPRCKLCNPGLAYTCHFALTVPVHVKMACSKRRARRSVTWAHVEVARSVDGGGSHHTRIAACACGPSIK